MTRYSLTHRGIAVTGAGGFVGRALSARLFVGKKPRRLAGDLADPRYCRRILRGARTVYHLAAAKKNSKCHTDEPYTFMAGNVLPLLTLLDAVRESRVKKFIFLSTTVVDYPGAGDGYAAGKRACELILENFAAQYPKIEIKIVRPVLIYGPGNDFDPASANFIAHQIVKVARAAREVEVWGSGRRRLQFIYIDDLARNLAAVHRRRGRLFVFGNPEAARVNEVVRKIIRLFGKELRIRNNARMPDKPTRIYKFNNPARPRISLDEGLRRTVQYYQKHAA